MLKVNISGPMAVGKTTVIQKLVENNRNFCAIYENSMANNELFSTIYSRESTPFGRNLKQMLYINDILQRLSEVDCDVVLLDKGIEDILFFWRNSNDLEFPNCKDNSFVDKVSCMVGDSLSDLIVYLDASDEVLNLRKTYDDTRSRGFFEQYIQNYREKEREYFLDIGAHIIQTDHLEVDQIAFKIEELVLTMKDK
ncbi:MAG: hypothetical protein ACRQFF_02865 [Sphaerochaeta sp.]